MQSVFDPRALAVLDRLCGKGYGAYLVGGCVRDALRGVPAHDYDAATSALPEQILECFPDLPTVGTGLRHGTVTVLCDGLPVEVTTFRVDGTYSDGRRPDGVIFTQSPEEDLARRDFTVNAMAWSERDGLCDPFGGQNDLRSGILRCVGDPTTRFHEDALRILRALRFASTLGFSLADGTANAVRDCRSLLSRVSSERIAAEMTRLLCGENAEEVLLAYPEVFATVLPELAPCIGFDQHSEYHCLDVYAHLARTVAHVPPLPHLRWAALLHDVAKPQCFSLDERGQGHFYSHAAQSALIAAQILQRLHFDRETERKVDLLIRCHDTPILPDEAAIRRRLNKLGAELYRDLVSLAKADNRAQAPHLSYRLALCDRALETAEAVLAEKQCLSLRELALDGNDLMALGYRGREIGSALQRLLDAVLDGTVENERETLLQYLNERTEDGK